VVLGVGAGVAGGIFPAEGVPGGTIPHVSFKILFTYKTTSSRMEEDE
jgi:hypothetical protein